jgi:hypothetical protein
LARFEPTNIGLIQCQKDIVVGDKHVIKSSRLFINEQ